MRDAGSPPAALKFLRSARWYGGSPYWLKGNKVPKPCFSFGLPKCGPRSTIGTEKSVHCSLMCWLNPVPWGLEVDQGDIKIPKSFISQSGCEYS